MADLMSTQYGGQGGAWFDDMTSPPREPITKITVYVAQMVDALEVTYGETVVRHGGGGGSKSHEISLSEGEQIIAVFGRFAQKVDAIGFVIQSSDGKWNKHGPYGGSGGSPFWIIGKVEAFCGSSDVVIDRIGVWVQPDVLFSAP